MKRRQVSKQQTSLGQTEHHAQPPHWQSVAAIPGFPFENFEQMQAAVAVRSFNIGVDSLAAAEWSDRFNSRASRGVITGLSVLLIAAAVAAIIAAFVTGEYWLLAAPLVQAAAFYVSHPASPIRKWVTIAGAASIVFFISFLFNEDPIAATIVAYAGLTFACVRAAGHVMNSSFRKALLSDEELFLAAYSSGVCTVRNNRTERVYAA